MVTQILSHTPPWVFALFIVLLVFGLMQTRTRAVRQLPALLLPVGMIALSLAGIQSSFGLRPVPLVAWAVALALSVGLGHALFRDRRVTFDAQAKSFTIPGSWTPLVVIMAIFFAKYAYGVMRGMQSPLITTAPFVIGVSAVYGLLSGYFAARALNLIRLRQRA